MYKIFTATLAAASLAAGAAQAASTTTTNIAVSATVQSTCSASATALGFGTYVPGAGALASNSTISIKCTKSTTYTVSLNGGSTSGGSVAQRLMANGTNTLQYNLYTTAAFATIFGDGTSNSQQSTGTGAGVGTANSVTVYGQLADNTANQAAVPGTYTDTVLVTVSY